MRASVTLDYSIKEIRLGTYWGQYKWGEIEGISRDNLGTVRAGNCLGIGLHSCLFDLLS